MMGQLINISWPDQSTPFKNSYHYFEHFSGHNKKNLRVKLVFLLCLIGVFSSSIYR